MLADAPIKPMVAIVLRMSGGVDRSALGELMLIGEESGNLCYTNFV